MRNLLFSLVLLFSVSAFAIPESSDSDIKQFIYETLKDDVYRKQILDKMHLLVDDFYKSDNKKAADSIKETIYYIENHNIRFMPEHQQKIVLVFIKNV